MVAGTVVIVIGAESADTGDVPDKLFAVTVKTTLILDPKPSTTRGDDEPVAVWFTR
jgi:hypothetical protein